MSKDVSMEEAGKLDKSGLLALLMDFPQQCRQAMKLAVEAKILFERRSFNKIVSAGLGGSAIGADFVKAYIYSESRVPMVVCREYVLPACIDSSTLGIISSYSGNTAETLSAYAQAREKEACIIAISSGGKLKELARKDKVTFIGIPRGLPPRFSLGYSSIIPVCLLSRLGFYPDKGPKLSRMADNLEKLRDSRLSPRTAGKDNIAKKIAAELLGKFVVIYAPSLHFDVCATRFRGQLNENAKVLASSHLFPEMSHNEIVGWQNPKKLFKDFVVVMLRDKLSHPRVNKCMDITASIFKKEGVKVLEVWSQGQELLERMSSLIYIGDFISYYLALMYGIDPAPVERITYLKKRLGKTSLVV